MKEILMCTHTRLIDKNIEMSTPYVLPLNEGLFLSFWNIQKPKNFKSIGMAIAVTSIIFNCLKSSF